MKKSGILGQTKVEIDEEEYEYTGELEDGIPMGIGTAKQGEDMGMTEYEGMFYEGQPCGIGK